MFMMSINIVLTIALSVADNTAVLFNSGDICVENST